MGVDKSDTRRNARQTIGQLGNRGSHGILDLRSRSRCVLVSRAEGQQPSAVDKSLQAERLLRAYPGEREQKIGASCSIDITTDSICSIMGTKTPETESTDIRRASK